MRRPLFAFSLSQWTALLPRRTFTRTLPAPRTRPMLSLSSPPCRTSSWREISGTLVSSRCTQGIQHANNFLSPWISLCCSLLATLSFTTTTLSKCFPIGTLTLRNHLSLSPFDHSFALLFPLSYRQAFFCLFLSLPEPTCSANLANYLLPFLCIPFPIHPFLLSISFFVF